MMRFALSLHSELSLDALRVALVSSLVARQRGEALILRIEDTDKTRSTLAAESRAILEKCALRYDHTLYQSESRHRHQQLAVSLLEQGKAFLCTCPPEADRCSGACRSRTPEELQRIRDREIPYQLRVAAPQSPIVFTDILQGEVTTQPREIGDIAILQTDGTPTDTFATAVDDMLGGISLVIRCEHYLAHTPGQIHIRNLLGYTEPITYAHLPPILPGAEPDSALSVPSLLREGFLPDAILNYLLHPEADAPLSIFTPAEASETFTIERLSPSPVPFDRARLRELNRQHLRRMDDKALSKLYGFADGDIGRLVRLYLDEAATLNELDARIRPVWAPKECNDTMRMLAEQIAEAPWLDRYSDFLDYLLETSRLPRERLVPLLRRLITGADSGPELEHIYPHLQSYITEVARCQP